KQLPEVDPGHGFCVVKAQVLLPRLRSEVFGSLVRCRLSFIWLKNQLPFASERLLPLPAANLLPTALRIQGMSLSTATRILPWPVMITSRLAPAMASSIWRAAFPVFMTSQGGAESLALL